MQLSSGMATLDTAILEPNTARILLVDDSAIARAVVGRGLKAAGMQVEEARGGEEALRLLAAGNYDVVITDLCMPGIDGFAVLASVKSRTPATEVVILSGIEDVERAVEGLRLGAHSFLPKPPAYPEQVLFTVRRALETKQLRDRCAHLQAKLAAVEPRGVRVTAARRTHEPRQVAAAG